MSNRTSYATATRGYDEAFERSLADAIAVVIATESIVTDAPIMALRTGETVGALVTTLASVLALTPDARSPTTLRRAVDAIAKTLRRKAAAAAADPSVRAFKTRGCFDGVHTKGRA